MQALSRNAMNISAFLSKLWKMVNDPLTDHLICWSPAGNSFIIQNQAQFWYEQLPLHYKHNNMSSFVRQLNMYDFHKMSSVDNDTIETERDEIQFFHPNFQKDKPELLANIKRKVTTAKASHCTEGTVIDSTIKAEDITKILTDVNQLRGRQANVDTQLLAMKRENAVLWRELAMLRQKHLKQQQIVNKLIQFLVTIVHPTARMSGGLGVKRRFPLMLDESHPKKAKGKTSSTSEGPIIHELDSADIHREELLGGTENLNSEQVKSPESASESQSNRAQSPQDLLDEVTSMDAISSFLESPQNSIDKPPNTVSMDELLSDTDLQESVIDPSKVTAEELYYDNPEMITNDDLKVFLSSTSQDTMLTNLANGSYNSSALTGKGKPTATKSLHGKQRSSNSNESDCANLTVATRDPNIGYSRMNSSNGTSGCCSDEFGLHVDNAQSELDQLKEILNGYNSFDANALLGLFNDESPPYGLSVNQLRDDDAPENDPLVSGFELTTYEPGWIDFNELLDDSQNVALLEVQANKTDESINTPQVDKAELEFPTSKNDSKPRTATVAPNYKLKS